LKFFSGVCFGTNNLEEAGKFYDFVFKSINVMRCQTTDNEIGYGYSIEEECFWVIKPFNKEPVISLTDSMNAALNRLKAKS